MTRIKYIIILINVGLSALFVHGQQIANYINNGGFEIPRTSNMQEAKYWRAIDTTNFHGQLLSYTITPFLVPASSYGYQWPRHGNNYLIGTNYYPSCSTQNCVGYPRNTLKQNLQAGHVYCFTMYVNLSDQSTHGIDAMGAYFTDSSNDTINYCANPITYLTPQVQNPVGNVLTDFTNWTKISGTYTASGSEIYVLLGTFTPTANINTTLTNTLNMPSVFSSYCFDDISCIDINLPAFAGPGPNTWCIPGDSVFIGRQPDVGIDEACMWYKLPNTTTAIDTVAGLWVKPITTTTYVVKQDICGNIKYDTIVVNQSATGLKDLQAYSDSISLSPNPTADNLNISFLQGVSQIIITNSLGQIVRQQDLDPKNDQINLQTSDLKSGLYQIHFKYTFGSATKKFVKTD